MESSKFGLDFQPQNPLSCPRFETEQHLKSKKV